MDFASQAELAAYVQSQLAGVLPTGWRMREEAATSTGRSWRLIPADDPDADYRVWAMDLGERFSIEYGNNDIGPLSLKQLLQPAFVFDRQALHFHSLGELVKHVIEHEKPNRWGYT